MMNGWSLAFASTLGAMWGSYAVTSGLRIAGGVSPNPGRSRCDACAVPLSYVRTIPILSFLKARGVCFSCGAPIDPTHLIGELSGVAVVVSAVTFATPPAVIAIVVVGLLLLAAGTVDFKAGRLPNALTLPIGLVCLALACRSGTQLLAGVTASIACATVLLGLRYAFTRSGRDPGIGLGDLKLLSGVALWLGSLTPWMIAGAAGMGLVVCVLRKKQRIHFGPYICIAAWIIGLAGEGGFV